MTHRVAHRDASSAARLLPQANRDDTLAALDDLARQRYAYTTTRRMRYTPLERAPSARPAATAPLAPRSQRSTNLEHHRSSRVTRLTLWAPASAARAIPPKESVSS